jgi:hypothetical protein
VSKIFSIKAAPVNPGKTDSNEPPSSQTGSALLPLPGRFETRRLFGKVGLLGSLFAALKLLLLMGPFVAGLDMDIELIESITSPIQAKQSSC